MESLLTNELAKSHFRSFLHSQFCVENLSFYEEVEKFRRAFASTTKKLYDKYIVDNASYQITLHSTIVRKLVESLEKPNITMYNGAQDEVFEVMSASSLADFKASSYCAMYIKEKIDRIEKAIRMGSVLYCTTILYNKLLNTTGSTLPC